MHDTTAQFGAAVGDPSILVDAAKLKARDHQQHLGYRSLEYHLLFTSTEQISGHFFRGWSVQPKNPPKKEKE